MSMNGSAARALPDRHIAATAIATFAKPLIVPPARYSRA
jgi:hypothetical protein